jgi:death-on-curing protein
MSRWLTLEEVLLMHDLALELDGGDAGILDLGRLESALAQPQAGFGDELFHPTLQTQAAAYLFHITQAHAFVDGNKRTGVLAALTFLQLNGITPTINEVELYELTLEVARGNLTKADIAAELTKE